VGQGVKLGRNAETSKGQEWRNARQKIIQVLEPAPLRRGGNIQKRRTRSDRKAGRKTQDVLGVLDTHLGLAPTRKGKGATQNGRVFFKDGR